MTDTALHSRGELTDCKHLQMPTSAVKDLLQVMAYHADG